MENANQANRDEPQRQSDQRGVLRGGALDNDTGRDPQTEARHPDAPDGRPIRAVAYHTDKELADRKARDKDEDHRDHDREPIVASKRVRIMHDALESLRDDLEAAADKHGFVVGPPTHFGLGFDVFDPNSGLVLTAARPHRSDVGEEAILLTVGGVVGAIIAARRHLAAVA
jgi:hypothetical protein